MSEQIPQGTYKGRGIAGSVQRGHSKNGTEQICIDLEIPSIGRAVTTFLYFSPDAETYSLDKLRALGWNGGEDPSFPGIDTNEVDVRIRYETFDGKERMKAEIVTGNGRVTLKETMNDQQTRGFMSRLSKLDKQSSPGGATANSTRKMAL